MIYKLLNRIAALTEEMSTCDPAEILTVLGAFEETLVHSMPPSDQFEEDLVRVMTWAFYQKFIERLFDG